VLTEILFEVPSKFSAALKAGELVRVGGLLKNVSTGHIVAHLQETGLAQSLISNIVLSGSPAGMAVKVASEVIGTGASIYTAYQVNQMKAMIENLQMLQVATLGVSLVAVGVSAASFVYMRNRFNEIDKKIDALLSTVAVGFEEVHKSALRSHLHQVAGLVKQAEQANSLASPNSAYARIADTLADQSAHFEGEIRHLSNSTNKINRDLFWQLVQALIACNTVRVDCRLKTNEVRNALIVAQSASETYEKLFDDLSPVSFSGDVKDSASMLTVIKDISDVAATKPYLLDYLHSRRIDGPRYLQSIESEERHPILMLKAS